MEKAKTVRALVLFSGGLDSMLAAETLRRQGICVTALSFETPFFSADKARESAAEMGLPLVVRDISEPHFAVVKNPANGYGKNMNPCIDCHGLMFQIAGEVAREEGYDFIATGEVLGQRPMSQQRHSLRQVEKIAGLPGQILRPLSAKLLPETQAEEKGLVDRQRLLALQSRDRNPQIELAKKWGIENYPLPGGSCRLTKPDFSGRLRKILAQNPAATSADTRLLDGGRLFVCGEKSFFIVARNNLENQKLRELAEPTDLLAEMTGYRGPIALARISAPDDAEEIAETLAQKIRRYGQESREAAAGEVEVQLTGALEKVIRI